MDAEHEIFVIRKADYDSLAAWRQAHRAANKLYKFSHHIFRGWVFCDDYQTLINYIFKTQRRVDHDGQAPVV